MMIRFVNYLALAAFALVSLGMSSEAHANTVYVRLDNYTNPSGYPNAKSSGTVAVCIDWAASWSTPKTGNICAPTKVLEVIASDWDFQFYLPGALTARDIKRVHIFFQTPGDTGDLLVIDQVETRDDRSGGAEDTFGADNETGYCFSSKSSSFSNTHCNGTTHVLAGVEHLILTNTSNTN